MSDLQQLLGTLFDGAIAASNAPAELPADKGAYILLLQIAHPLDLEISTLPRVQLAAGHYLYCGSAYGPGGIRARVKRHFSKTKSRHWHVDHLTLAATRLQALPEMKLSECELVDALTQTGQFRFPVPGFGATDCKACASHLLVWLDQS